MITKWVGITHSTAGLYNFPGFVWKKLSLCQRFLQSTPCGARLNRWGCEPELLSRPLTLPRTTAHICSSVEEPRQRLTPGLPWGATGNCVCVCVLWGWGWLGGSLDRYKNKQTPLAPLSFSSLPRGNKNPNGLLISPICHMHATKT